MIDTPNSFGESLAICGKAVPKGVLLPVDEIRPTLNEEILTKMSTACEEAGTKTVINRDKVLYRVGLELYYAAGWHSNGKNFGPEDLKLFVSGYGPDKTMSCQDVLIDILRLKNKSESYLYCDECGSDRPSLCMGPVDTNMEPFNMKRKMTVLENPTVSNLYLWVVITILLGILIFLVIKQNKKYEEKIEVLLRTSSSEDNISEDVKMDEEYEREKQELIALAALLHVPADTDFKNIVLLRDDSMLDLQKVQKAREEEANSGVGAIGGGGGKPKGEPGFRFGEVEGKGELDTEEKQNKKKKKA